MTNRIQDTAQRVGEGLQEAAGQAVERLDEVVGGPARRRVLVLLAAVLGLASADQATVGASATQLRAALHLDQTGIGLIAACSGLVGALATVPLGSLVDRMNRTRLLGIGIAGWAVVMALSATASSLVELIILRCALGGVVAIATPAVASLVGDFFPPAERGRIWGYVLTGELIGTGFGFTVAGSLASISWRVSFAVLALPAIALAVLMWRLPEPARGGPGRLPSGTEEVRHRQPRRRAGGSGEDDGEASDAGMSAAQLAAVGADLAPYDELVITEDPSRWTLWQAVRYVLRVRTNVVLIVTGAAGYFFLSAARSFGIEFVKAQYGVGQGVASVLALVLGAFAIAGVIGSGWLSDRLGLHGHLRGRIWVAVAALGAATVLFVPALLVTSIGLGILSLGCAAACLAALNPPLDAGRLDIMHPTLWGRAEAVRTLFRQPAEAVAPVLFGVLADHLFGGGHAGVQAAFLIMLAPLAASVLILLRARKTYPRDVATAAASIERTCH